MLSNERTKCDTTVILGGRYDTVDELFEILTWKKASSQNEHAHVVDTDGFYALTRETEKCILEQLLYQDLQDAFTVLNELIRIFTPSPCCVAFHLPEINRC